MRKRYLREHRPVLYTNLLTTGKLGKHLAEIDRSCEEQLERIMQQMGERENVTEALKAADQMEWVRRIKTCLSLSKIGWFIKKMAVYIKSEFYVYVNFHIRKLIPISLLGCWCAGHFSILQTKTAGV